MIRNNYLLAYEPSNNSSIIGNEDKFISAGENFTLYLDRPLEISKIKKIKENKLYKFIDDIMCDKTINNLLYSSNARKIASFYLKQKKFLLRQHLPLIIDEDNLFRKKVISFPEKMRRESIMESIRDNIIQFRIDRNRYLTQMMEKNDEFINSQPNIDKKIEKLNSKTINELRLNAYKKAFEKCLNLSLTRNKFQMPDLSNKDVFGRLYNNSVLRINQRNKRNNSADKIKNSNKNPLSYKNLLKKYKISKTYKSDNDLEYDVNQHYNKKIVKFKLNSNITKSGHNMKQFNVIITKKKIRRCWSAISGGPKSKKEEKKRREKLEEKLKEKYNYKILSCKGDGDINDLSLYNTMVVDDPFLRKYMIKNSNYRDRRNNSSLHIAVNNNSIKMVKYLLNKKDKKVNAKNDDGQTALHLACAAGKDDIINLLIRNDANINAKDSQGNKPFDLVSSERNQNH